MKSFGKFGSPSLVVKGANIRLVLATVFALCFWLVDWEWVRGSPFDDLNNSYIKGFSDQRYQYDTAAGLIEWYSNEYLWRAGIYALGEHFSFDAIFYGVSLICLIAVSYYVVIRSGSAVYLFILVSPVVIDQNFSGVRSALAISIFWVALLVRSRVFSGPLFLVAPFIHSAIALYSFVALVVSALDKWAPLRRHRKFFLVFLVCAALIVLGPLLNQLLESIGDRRANLETSRSGALLFLMLSSYALPFVFTRAWINDFNAFLVVLSCGLCIVVYSIGGNGNRFVWLVMPALAVAISKIKNRKVRVFSFFYVMLSSGVYFYYWIDF